MASPRVILVGPPGSGKSSVGRVLATAWGVGWRDTDEDVADAAGMTVAQIFLDHGEAHFRELEKAAVAAALNEHDGVVSLGGGAVLDRDTQTVLRGYGDRGGAIVFLDVSLTSAAPRVGFNRSRPLLVGNPRQQWQALMDARRPIYEGLATMAVLTDRLTPEQVAQSIEEWEERR